MSDKPESHWWHYNEKEKRYDFTETLEHMFAPGTVAQRRIGQMSRDELITVIATGYDERERLALALTAVTSARVYLPEAEIEQAKRLAGIIVDRVWREHKGLADGG